jgi:hypothetical protein
MYAIGGTMELPKKYQKMISDVAEDIVFELKEDSLRRAWVGSDIPEEEWEKRVVDEITAVFSDILVEERNAMADAFLEITRTMNKFLDTIKGEK